MVGNVEAFEAPQEGASDRKIREIVHRMWHDTETLARMARAQTGPAGEPAELAYRLRDMRDARDGVFGRLFSDPGWDLLISLFIAGFEGRTLGQQALIRTARLTPAVGMRWLAKLEEEGLVGAVASPAIRRGRAAVLTERGRAMVVDALERML